MNDVLFLRGLLIGCSIAAVVGPIGLLCIQRTFYKGYLYGLFLQTSRAHKDRSCAIYCARATINKRKQAQ